MGAAVLSAACASILGFERLSEDEATTPTTEAGTLDAAEAGTDAAPVTCPEIGVPPAPPPTGNSDAGHEILSAVSLLDFGIDVNQSLPGGYNLDRTCTNVPTQRTCTSTQTQGSFDKYERDGDGGLDNAGVRLFADIAAISSEINPTQINARLREGQYGAILRVKEWNGLPTDESVFFEFYPALRVVAPDGGSVPSFTPTDRWKLDDRFEIAPGIHGSQLRATAYVTDNRVVAYFDELIVPLVIPGDPKLFDAKLREVWVTATIATDTAGGPPRLTDGIISGRWRTVDFFEAVRTIYLVDTGSLSDVVVCDVNRILLYDVIQSTVCQSRDIRAASKDDGQNLPCDSFSIGVRFDTYGVTDEGDFVPSNDAGPPRCQNDPKVPAGDDCK